MQQFFKDYFTFNKRERRGIVVLVLLIVVLILYLNLSDFFYSQEKTDFSQFENEIDQFYANLDSSVITDTASKEQLMAARMKKPERFFFNPNQLAEKDWMRMGLTLKQVKTIKNFENAGGRFYRKDDLRKVFVISAEFYQSVEPFIQIPSDSGALAVIPVTPSFKSEKKVLEINVNSADTVQLKKLRGIGSGYARRIMQYRERLGGFVNINQLMEVWGMTPQLFDTLAMYMTIDTAGIVRKNINQCSLEELKNHPYIGWNVANAIIAYREKHGLYKSVNDIRNTDLVDEELYIKLAPYLTVH